MSKSKIKSVSVLPVNGIFGVYSDENSFFKSRIHGIACVQVEDKDGEHSVNLIPLEMADFNEGYILLNENGYGSKSANFHGLITDESEPEYLTEEQIKALGLEKR